MSNDEGVGVEVLTGLAVGENNPTFVAVLALAENMKRAALDQADDPNLELGPTKFYQGGAAQMQDFITNLRELRVEALQFEELESQRAEEAKRQAKREEQKQ